jgi:hypothetical protein
MVECWNTAIMVSSEALAQKTNIPRNTHYLHPIVKNDGI